jgi:hypothetical protein
MKTVKFFFSLLLASAMTISSFGQSHDHSNMNMSQSSAKAGTQSQETMNKITSKTESFKVSGKCEMCKARIVKTVKGEGATDASWDAKTQLLTVSYNPSKLNRETFSKKLASVGHDTELFKASDEAYAKLPGCCHYERSK